MDSLAALDGLKRRARSTGMPLDDATLCRYLECAGWRLAFDDRSVCAAIEARGRPLEWRASERELPASPESCESRESPPPPARAPLRHYSLTEPSSLRAPPPDLMV